MYCEKKVSPRMIILDRDGVINHDSDAYIKSVSEWQPIKGSLEAIARLAQADFYIAVATNQSGIARGLLTHKTLDAIHAKMQKHLSALGGRIDALFFCPHGPDEGCFCRKPKPGLLQMIRDHSGQSLQHIPVVGDSLRDLQAAAQMGCQPILVRTGKGEKTLYSQNLPDNTLIFEDLAGVSDYLLATDTNHICTTPASKT